MSANRRKLPLSLHEHVVDELGGRIVRGELKADETLPTEDGIAEAFGVSRTVVREAIKVLVHKRLLEVRTRTGTRVLRSASWNHLDPDILQWRFASALDAKFVSDVIELRRIVEPAAAELAATRATRSAVHAIEAALHDMATTTDVNAHHAADLRFHLCILEAAGNDLLLGFRHGIEGALSFAIRLLTRSKEEGESSHALHKAVADAITRKDPAMARAAMDRLVDRWAVDSLRMISSNRKGASNRSAAQGRITRASNRRQMLIA
ncbi:MAG TPA: FadR/GntR family transcriptional regulator [Casimicrobiaceae bacterium]|nr:FadR/GntR family transcriptional regulator [Casimicrobiaceae bacterium]